jgi:hypothetical protein
MLMGAAVVGFLGTATVSAAYAQQTDTSGQFNERVGGQPMSTRGQPNGPVSQGQRSGMNEQLNARGDSGRMSQDGRLDTARRRGLAEERGVRGTEERRGLAEQRGVRGERSLYARAGVEGGYGRERRSDRWTYRERATDVGAGVAAAHTRRLYAYAPTYAAGYAAVPNYAYTPGYDATVGAGRYYAPGWNMAYAAPYYDYAPGFSFGVGIGPVGIGVGPAWGW